MSLFKRKKNNEQALELPEQPLTTKPLKVCATMLPSLLIALAGLLRCQCSDLVQRIRIQCQASSKTN